MPNETRIQTRVLGPILIREFRKHIGNNMPHLYGTSWERMQAVFDNDAEQIHIDVGDSTGPRVRWTMEIGSDDEQFVFERIDSDGEPSGETAVFDFPQDWLDACEQADEE